jgi:hypothetical protein
MSAIAYATAVTTILSARYVPILPMIFKFTAYALGSTSLPQFGEGHITDCCSCRAHRGGR